MDKGAHFFRTDLQVHSPRDTNWNGTRPKTSDERAEYAADFVARCRKAGLNAVAITDHHDLAFYPFIRAAAQAETDDRGLPLQPEQQLVVFPGIELTLAVPCQALLIFDAGLPLERISMALPNLGIEPIDSSKAYYPQTTRLEHLTTLNGVCDRLDESESLRGHYILLPHVGQSGQFSILRRGFAPRYKRMRCVGGFVDGDLSQHGKGNASILAGLNKDWGNKRLGLFQTSDSRDRDFSKLGSHSTWVKWAMPTAEALRQACLAADSRISQSAPSLPASRVTFIRVSSSKFLGPIDLFFNPQYTALIGGRGTGKSSILEYIRWCLCDQPGPEHEDDRYDPHSRRRSLVDNTLVEHGATVEVGYLVGGVLHVVRRKARDGSLAIKVGEEDFRQCTESEVRLLLPLNAYSQKQLSSVGVRLEELNRFVHGPIQRKLSDLEHRAADAVRQMTALHGELQVHRHAWSEVREADLEMDSLTKQLDLLRDQLADVGLEDRQTIDSHSRLEAEQRLIQKWAEQLTDFRAEVRKLRDHASTLPTPNADSSSSTELVKDAGQRLRSWYGMAATQLAVISPIDLEDDVDLITSVRDAWRAAWDEHQDQYEKAKERLAEHETVLGQVENLEKQRARLDVKRNAALAKAEASSGAPKKFYEHRDILADVARSFGVAVGQQCAQLTQQSNGLLRATLRLGHGLGKVEQLLKSGLKGSGVRGDRVEKILSSIQESPDPVDRWHEIQDELLQLIECAESDSEMGRLPDVNVLRGCGFNDKDLRKTGLNMSATEWLALALETPSDEPEFQYRAREDDYIRFGDASAGQQATALLFVLLTQDGPPLVIDQPEDDLDNKVMQEVVRRIWAAKSRRQLIFSSHNANLVVNGDAELVVVCDYRVAGDQSGGKIKLEGAIDVPEINQEIASIMEGGREAFALRRAKYGF